MPRGSTRLENRRCSRSDVRYRPRMASCAEESNGLVCRISSRSVMGFLAIGRIPYMAIDDTSSKVGSYFFLQCANCSKFIPDKGSGIGEGLTLQSDARMMAGLQLPGYGTSGDVSCGS